MKRARASSPQHTFFSQRLHIYDTYIFLERNVWTSEFQVLSQLFSFPLSSYFCFFFLFHLQVQDLLFLLFYYFLIGLFFLENLHCFFCREIRAWARFSAPKRERGRNILSSRTFKNILGKLFSWRLGIFISLVRREEREDEQQRRNIGTRT